MINCLSYALFGYDRAKQVNCYDFNSYLRYFSLILRMNKLLYPGWDTVLHIDTQTYRSPFKTYFDKLNDGGHIVMYEVTETDPLCKAMLWRLKPAFEEKYNVVLCRDVDSLECYKGRAAVHEWMKNGTKTLHCMTDSVSHNIPLMGGMLGVMSPYFRERSGASSWNAMLRQAHNDFSKKGSDQDFLNANILPRVSDSMVEHYFLGMPQSFKGSCLVGQHIMDNVVVEGIPFELKESNHLVNHIGQSGFAPEPVFKFFEKHAVMKGPVFDIEREFSDVFYWTKEM